MDRALRNNLGYYDPEKTAFRERWTELSSSVEARLQPKKLPERFQPNYHFETVRIASGERLIQDGALDEFSKRDERVMAGDEESFGVSEALQGRPVAIVRGISDYGVKRKPRDWQYFAALAAALAVRDFLEEEYLLPKRARF